MTTADRLVLVAAIALVGTLYGLFWQGGDAQAARVTLGGDTLAELPLDRDRQFTVDGPMGGSVVEVRNGRVRFVASPCANKLCIHSGWLDRGGEFAACLPNRVSLQIIGGEKRFDAINF